MLGGNTSDSNIFLPCCQYCCKNPVQILAVNLNEQSAFLVKGREQWHEGEMKNEKGMKHFAVDL